jgi:putative spermidine/putrescine transport system permease protein
LGAGWFTVIVRVIVPNLGAGILSAAFISVALVLGEFTFASLLNYQTLPVVIALFGKSNSQVSVAASLAIILFASALLLLLSYASRSSRGRKGA